MLCTRNARPIRSHLRNSSFASSPLITPSQRTRCIPSATGLARAIPSSFVSPSDPRSVGVKKARSTTARATEPSSSVTLAGSDVQGSRRIRVYYLLKNHDTRGFGLHTWGACVEHTQWQQPLRASGYDAATGAAYWDLLIRDTDAPEVGVLVHKGEEKAARAEVVVPSGTSEVWLVGTEQRAWLQQPDLSEVPAGSINKQGALWLDKHTIAWRYPLEEGGRTRSFKLHCCATAAMRVTGTGVEGADISFDLVPGSTSLPPRLAEKYPFLSGCSTLTLPPEAAECVRSLVTGQLMVSMAGPDGGALDATGVQMHGALDELYAYDGALGYHEKPAGGGLAVSVWAPTAQSVVLLRWPKARGGDAPTEHTMALDAGTGVWSMDAPDEWYGQYYLYRVTVYCPWTQKVEVSESTDPYSFSLAADGARTHMVRITDPALKPAGWDSHAVAPLHQWTDISVYELHVRDFSATDSSVPEALRGKYLAFDPASVAAAAGTPLPPSASGAPPAPPTAGLQHLALLRAAGLNHVHLLPVYDFGSVPERTEDQAVVGEDLSVHAADSEAQQASVMAIAHRDAFNWGYDPVHWSVPEGSYATDPDGPVRITEFRTMVMALHAAGWHVIVDVVYNHVYASGPHNKYSVLDKIVPGYYQRRMEDGEICQSTCCNNTAAENYMCERLMVDDIVHWARHYHIDAFRFDIMGHLLVSTLAKMRTRLAELTLEADGIDGRSIYIYGEAWDLGEMVDNQRGVNCGQMNLSGTGLGAFNDRLRDGALGGGPFDPYFYQGLVTGLGLAPNGLNPHRPREDMDDLAKLTDMVRYSLAGNLRSYPLLNSDGVTRTGEDARLHGLPLAYGAFPHEHVAFIGCHDNLTIFDYVSEKSPVTATAEERMRMCVMCMALVALSQGIVFFHAADDLLRSKSLDRDSYNAGDHFNRIDWTGEDNSFGSGLPNADKNKHGWDYKRRLLGNPMLKPKPAQIRLATQIFQLLLRIRYSSPLFRLARTEDVLRQVSFPLAGPDQPPALLLMELTSAEQLPNQSNPPTGVMDPSFKRVLVVFNCSPLPALLPAPPAASGAGAGPLVLHPLQAAFSADARMSSACKAEGGMLKIAARATAVFVELR